MGQLGLAGSYLVMDVPQMSSNVLLMHCHVVQQARRAPPADALARKISKVSDYVDKKEIAKIQKQEQHVRFFGFNLGC